MRCIATLAVFAVILFGCARTAQNPTAPAVPGVDQERGLSSPQAQVSRDGPYRLWWEGEFFIDSAHERVDVVPRRDPHFHLNALKFLEEYCKDCLQITGIHNNGDGTIDLTVRITHPFKGFPQYTGFDVKGIIMFNGSCGFTQTHPLIPLPNPFYVSWRLMGDPEVLNADGYTPRWSPKWDSGSTLPILNYWKGRYAIGTPNADLNAYLNFYSQEERHIFATNSHVERTYRIWLPPGKPVVAGYAVEACWEPPTVTPVTNPIEDFPLSANQPEAYYFRYVVNNGEEITDCDEWQGPPWYDCGRMYVELHEWGGITSLSYRRFHPGGGFTGGGFYDCDPPIENRFAPYHLSVCQYGNGTFRGVCLNFWFDGYFNDIAYTVFDWTVNDPDLED
jgi:hypothetical protein